MSACRGEGAEMVDLRDLGVREASAMDERRRIGRWLEGRGAGDREVGRGLGGGDHAVRGAGRGCAGEEIRMRGSGMGTTGSTAGA